MDRQTPRQFDMFADDDAPDDTPDGVLRFWAAKRRWYATGTHKLPLRDEFAKVFEPPISVRTLDRIRHDHPELPWKPKRNDQPAWHTDSANGVLMPAVDTQAPNVVQGEVHKLRKVRTAGFDEEGNPVRLVQEYDTVDGRLVNSYLDEPMSPALRQLHHLPVAAATFFGILDVMADGRMDGVVRFFKLIGCTGALG